MVLSNFGLEKKRFGISAKLALMAAVLVFVGCSDIRFDEAKTLDKEGRLAKAAENYVLFADKHPSDSKAAFALFRAGEIYSEQFDLCGKSKPLFEKLIRNYPKFPDLKKANKRVFMCPDYFPMSKKRKWIYGDSQTGGKNMKHIVSVISVKADSAKMKSVFYAGKQFVQKKILSYRMSDSLIRERHGKSNAAILKYPIKKHDKWVGRQNGNKVYFQIISVGINVKVVAGTFKNCIKIRQMTAGLPSWLYVYYAPWIGKVLTTVGGPTFENRAEELISYEK